ncbi:MAG: hypothetical protein RLZZ127_693 [Planctomycetota bacterium]|jgi:hypothetical protein
MDGEDPDIVDPDRLLRDLAALDRAGTAVLALVARADADGPGPGWAWRLQAALARLLWHLYRAEDAFAGWAFLPAAADPPELPPADDRFPEWRGRVDRVVAAAGLASVHRRCLHPLDPDDEAVTVDAATDLALVCAAIEAATPALRRLERLRRPGDLDGLAFLAVLGPWRARGAVAAAAALAWLQALRSEDDPW